MQNSQEREMSQELATKQNYLLPQSFEQAERYAEKIANSSLCPNAFKGKGGDVLIAIQMGAEVGLSPMQAIQNIAVINGRPCLWGDAAIGVVRVHSHCQSIREWMEGTIESGAAVAYCAVTRKGQHEEIRSFSIENAKKAGLWGKTGPWSQYPQRMLQMRARGFAIRDTFPDALRGLHIAEEAQDIIDITTITPETRETIEKHKLLEGVPLSQSLKVDDELLNKYLDEITNCTDKISLQEIYKSAKNATKGDKIASNKISITTKERLDYLKQLSLEDKPIENKESTEEFYAAYNKEEVK